MDGFGPSGWRALHPGVGPPVCPGWGGLCGSAPWGLGLGSLSVWLVPPKVASSMPQVSLPSHVSLVTASVCVSVCVSVAMCVCVSVCMSMYVFVYVSVHVFGGRRVGFF